MAVKALTQGPNYGGLAVLGVENPICNSKP